MESKKSAENFIKLWMANRDMDYDMSATFALWIMDTNNFPGLKSTNEALQIIFTSSPFRKMFDSPEDIYTFFAAIELSTCYEEPEQTWCHSVKLLYQVFEFSRNQGYSTNFTSRVAPIVKNLLLLQKKPLYERKQDFDLHIDMLAKIITLTKHGFDWIEIFGDCLLGSIEYMQGVDESVRAVFLSSKGRMDDYPYSFHAITSCARKVRDLSVDDDEMKKVFGRYSGKIWKLYGEHLEAQLKMAARKGWKEIQKHLLPVYCLTSYGVLNTWDIKTALKTVQSVKSHKFRKHAKAYLETARVQ